MFWKPSTNPTRAIEIIKTHYLWIAFITKWGDKVSPKPQIKAGGVRPQMATRPMWYRLLGRRWWGRTGHSMNAPHQPAKADLLTNLHSEEDPATLLSKVSCLSQSSLVYFKKNVVCIFVDISWLYIFWGYMWYLDTCIHCVMIKSG